jgi:hypothetical protein
MGILIFLLVLWGDNVLVVWGDIVTIESLGGTLLIE